MHRGRVIIAPMAEKNPKAPEEQKASLISNILAIVGLVIVIGIVVWGLLNVAQISKSWFVSLFKPVANSLKVTVPSPTATSGTAVAISWKYNTNAAGSYSFLYQCSEGFQFKTADSLNAIPCGAPFSLPRSRSSFSVTPVLTSASSLAVPFSVTFVPNATSSKRVQGNVSITVIAEPNERLATTAQIPETVEPAPAGNASVAAATAAAAVTEIAEYGLPDLSVRILSVGVIDPISGDIIPRRPTSPNDLVAVRFDIANIGTASAGTWYFTAQIPTPIRTYFSPAQIPLAPGAHIENMLRFTQVYQNGGPFFISVDTSNIVPESNEANNFASINI